VGQTVRGDFSRLHDADDLSRFLFLLLQVHGFPRTLIIVIVLSLLASGRFFLTACRSYYLLGRFMARDKGRTAN